MYFSSYKEKFMSAFFKPSYDIIICDVIKIAMVDAYSFKFNVL